MSLSRRTIQIGLGCLWLLDGLFQLQHQMFTSRFANVVLSPVAALQPNIVSGPMHLAIRLILTHPAIFDAFFALVQLTLGVLILVRKTVKIGLIASVFWGLGVWFIGEGLGSLLSWHTTLFMGLPGAALIYVILALAVMPKKNDSKPEYWLPIVWAGVWLLGTLYFLLPGQNNSNDSAVMFNSMTVGVPHWIAVIDHHTAKTINSLGDTFVIGTAVIQTLIGLMIFLKKPYRNLAVYLGIVVSLIYWTIGQQFGNFYSGLATDLNSGPLFILLGLSVLSCQELSVKSLFQRVSRDISQKII